jgi:hypothetical protein
MRLSLKQEVEADSAVQTAVVAAVVIAVVAAAETEADGAVVTAGAIFRLPLDNGTNQNGPSLLGPFFCAQIKPVGPNSCTRVLQENSIFPGQNQIIRNLIRRLGFY